MRSDLHVTRFFLIIMAFQVRVLAVKQSDTHQSSLQVPCALHACIRLRSNSNWNIVYYRASLLIMTRAHLAAGTWARTVTICWWARKTARTVDFPELRGRHGCELDLSLH
jgi:hypothetical protein